MSVPVSIVTHEQLLLEADRVVEEARERAAAQVHATLGPPPIDKWPSDTCVSPITGALARGAHSLAESRLG